MALEPPPEQEFDELEAAKDFINLHAKQHGYALTKDRDRFTKRKELRRVDYRCDKGGKKRGEGVVRQSSTRMTECPLDIRIQSYLVIRIFFGFQIVSLYTVYLYNPILTFMHVTISPNYLASSESHSRLC